MSAPKDEGTLVQHDSPLGLPTASRRLPHLSFSDASGKHEQAISQSAVLGSSPQVDIVIEDVAVSRIHAKMHLRKDGLWIEDLASRNGTYVDGVRVSGARLADGSRIRVGTTTLNVSYESNAKPVELWSSDRFGDLVGRSIPMRELFARAKRVAQSDSPVLIQGDTGTGKELLARAIHDVSPKREGPFVVVDCAAMPEHLLEAELFGHARGAFTGAVAERHGMIVEAEGGSLFLDEIGELPLAMQAKLLRVLETRAVRRIGESQTRQVDVRFMSATHRDLRLMVNQSAFREDLYFRIAVLPIEVPRLRDRVEDIPLLVEHFMPKDTAPTIAPELLREISTRPWLGNVRELRNFVERAVALGAKEALSGVDSMPRTETGELPPITLDRPLKEIRQEWLDHLERHYIQGLLARHERNISAVAQAAGLHRTYVHRLINKHNL